MVANKDYFICNYCGAYYFPDASEDGVKILGEPGSDCCPVCKITLVAAMVGEMHIQACSRCRGVLLPQEYLSFIIKTLRLTSNKIEAILPLERDDLKQVRTCQTCGQKMDTHPYGGGGNVVIDVCLHCGVVWFDYGELKRIITAPDFSVNR
jgi:Zn-finger nucleic acid-binding protein